VNDGGSVGLAGDQVQVTHGGWPETRAEEVVAEGEMLGVVPQRSHSVAIVIAHDEALSFVEIITAALGSPIELNEFVHQPVAHGFLLTRIIVALIADDGFFARHPKGLDRIRVVRHQRPAQAVHTKGAVARTTWNEQGLSARIGGIRIGGEVMIERNVLLEDDHQMSDRRCGLRHSEDSRRTQQACRANGAGTRDSKQHRSPSHCRTGHQRRIFPEDGGCLQAGVRALQGRTGQHLRKIWMPNRGGRGARVKL
jgi:hypothetical protein